MKDNIKLLLQNKDSNLTEWETRFLESIYDRTSRNRALTHKQVSILNKCLVKNDLISVERDNSVNLSDDLLIKKLEDIVIRTNTHKDKRYEFFSSLLKFYYSKGYLSQKQKEAVMKFDINYSGKSWTAKPK